MDLDSPTQALGVHAQGARKCVVDVIRSRHQRAAAGHLASESRYAIGFGAQWRDLLDDTSEAFTSYAFDTHKLAPAGYKLPIINNCLIYVWRCPDTPDAEAHFASSPTRKNGFTVPPPDPMLYEPEIEPQDDSHGDLAESDLEHVVRAADGVMPLVLVMFHSSPSGLKTIEWAIAKLDEQSDTVKLIGREVIWEPEASMPDVTPGVESFDSGTPDSPHVEPREEEGNQPDA